MDPWNTKTYRRDDFVFAYEPHVMFTADETWSHGREPVLRRMPDGSLFSTIFSGGIIEPDPGNVVLGIRSEDDGETWSRPQVVSRHPSRPTWATEVFTDGDLPLLFVHTFHCETYYFEIKSYVSTTHDSGRTWTGPVSVPGVPANFSVRTGPKAATTRASSTSRSASGLPAGAGFCAVRTTDRATPCTATSRTARSTSGNRPWSRSNPDTCSC
jgi:hypothetical protein